LALSSPVEPDVFSNPLEKSVHDIWCQVLQCNEQHISTTTNFFSIGGHSLLLIELYHRYQFLFGFDSREISIAPFLQQPTIAQHATLLETINTGDTESKQWHSLHIHQGNIL
jgi:aryl carrier-like protein